MYDEIFLGALLSFAVIGAAWYLVEWMRSLPIDKEYPYTEYDNEEDE